jgi:hypothetical protein
MANDGDFAMSKLAPRRAETRVRQKALQPEERFCRILRKRVTVLVEYPDYHSPWNKGVEGELYCENIINCYQNCIECRYSGISPLYPDPFEGVPRDVREAERLFGTADAPKEPAPDTDLDEDDEESQPNHEEEDAEEAPEPQKTKS